MAEQEQDRSEAATPFRLREARRKGSVAKSMEVASLFALMTLLAVLALQGFDALQRLLRLTARLLDQGGQMAFEPPTVLRWLEAAGGEALSLLMPLLLAVVAIAILGGLLQTGPIFSTHALKPDVQRINPVEGFKRFFTIRLLFETVKNVLKLVFFGAALWWLFEGEIASLLGLLGASPQQVLHTSFDHALMLVFKLTLIVAVFALADMVFTRWHWMDKLRMSRREIKEELKQHEGDPRVRQRLRELRQEMLARARSARRLPEADVLITNPTHVAVALLYRRETMSAPQLIAKGSGEAVLQMKALARRHGVPVVENRTLARALFRGEIDQPIAEKLFPQVARLLVWVYALKERRA